MIKYVKYNEGHYKTLFDMINKLYVEDPEGEPISPDKINATIHQAEHFPERLHIYIFEDCNEPAGYAIIQLLWSNEWGCLTANIDEMYVIESKRNLGFATKFIRSLPELIPETSRITLEVTPSNNKGLNFYKALGFKQAENRFMELTLKD
jgi:GNAT superfamily N-acetyltransferase